MNQELKDLLAKLNGNLEQINKSANVKNAADMPAGDPANIETKALNSQDLDEVYVDPLRKNFERLAKAAPSHFGMIGSTKALENPYLMLREKKADGTYVISNADMDLMMRGILALNKEKPEQHGAVRMDEWMEKSGNSPSTIQTKMHEAAGRGDFGENGDMLRRTLDVSAGAPLIRTDIEPLLRETFNRFFPAYDMIPKIPANGLKHTWNQKTSFGTASLVSELGSLSATDSTSGYGQAQSTNIGIFASQRAIGLKAQFASTQSGMNFNLAGDNNNEIVSAIQAIANLVQSQIFQGNEATGGGTLANEDGLLNANGFTGLRQQLKGAGFSITRAAENYLDLLNRAAGQLFDNGADLNSLLMFASVGATSAISKELMAYLRVLKGDAANGPLPTNLSEYGLTLLNGILARPQMVPAQGTQANGIGYYTFSATATEDVYLLDPNGVALPYLGSPSPTVLQLPLGYDNRLANVYIPFCMFGFAIFVKNFNRKIRIQQITL